MTPWERAKLWQTENSTQPFEEVVGWHLSCGVVYSTSQLFLLAHEVHYDPTLNQASHDQPHNAWFIELAAVTRHLNPFCEFMKIAPHPQEWIVFHRRNSFEPHAYRWSRFASKVRFGGTTSVSSVSERGVI